MRAVRIENSVVADLWEVPSLDAFEGVTLLAVSDEVGMGWGFVDGEFIAPTQDVIEQPKRKTIEVTII